MASICLFFYGYWELIDYLHHFIVKEIKVNQHVNSGDILTVLFGISSSILALVGLVTIFVSINSQHRIQRCRELLWELMEIPYQCWDDLGKFHYKFSLEQDIRQRLIIYQQTLKSGLIFNYIVVTYLVVVILAVSGIIIITTEVLKDLYFTNLSEYHIIYSLVIVGVIIMIMFAILLLSLTQIGLIASLPQLDDIMNADTSKSDIPGILLAAICMRVMIADSLIVRFTFPFQNIEIYPWIIGILKDTNEEVLIKGGPFEHNPNKKKIDQQYIDHSRAHRLHYIVSDPFELDFSLYEKIRYKFELNSKQGKVYVEFEQNKNDSSLENEGRIHPISIIPKLSIEDNLFKNLENVKGDKNKKWFVS